MVQKISWDTVKNKQFHTVGTIPKSHKKIIETEATLIHLTHEHMTAHFPVVVQALPLKVAGLNLL